MPTFDETTGAPADEIEIKLIDIPISRVVVEHNAVTFFDGHDRMAFIVARRVPGAPGEGLAFDMHERIQPLSVTKRKIL